MAVVEGTAAKEDGCKVRLAATLEHPDVDDVAAAGADVDAAAACRTAAAA